MGIFSRRQSKQAPPQARLEAELENTQRDMAAMRQQVANQGDTQTGGSMEEWMSANMSASGVHVNEQRAMQVSSVYACIRVIAGAIGSLPLQIFRRVDGSRARDNDHPWYPALHEQPHPMMSATVFWETVLAHILLTGNAYALIDRGRNSNTLYLLKPSAVQVFRSASHRLLYSVQLDTGEWLDGIDQDDMLHIPGVGWDGVKGLSVIKSVGQNSIGTALAADTYSGQFFANDATPRGYIKYPEGKKIDEKQAKILRDYWFEKNQGLSNSHLPAILSNGAEFKEVTMSAEDAQLIETRRFQVTDIARIFGVPPHMIGETSGSTSWGTGIEQQSIGFVVYTLRPHLNRIEQELKRKIFRESGHFAEFNVAGLLRGDVKARNDAYKIALGGNQEPGYMTVNEVRGLENLPPIAGGEELYRPLTGDTTDATKE